MMHIGPNNKNLYISDLDIHTLIVTRSTLEEYVVQLVLGTMVASI